MSLRDRIKAKSASLVKTEMVEVPLLGVTVKVRGMMLGERNRVMNEGYDKSNNPIYPKLYPLVLGIAASDPDTGEQIWNPNSLDDVNEINAMPGDAADAIFSTALRLSGMSKEGKELGDSTEKENSASSSPSATESSPAS